MWDADDAGALIGADVGEYVIECELGRGGMGIVYAAVHPMIGKRVAIKVLQPALSRDAASVARLVQEARTVNRIRHPGIVDIFAFGTLPDGRCYLVMDLLDGESLRKRLRRGPVVIADAVQIVDDIASALGAVHDAGFVHRDVKPENVFLVQNDGRLEAKLLDFGLAKLVSGVDERVFRTAIGTQVGTPEYMAPEQLRAADVDQRADLFALGVVAFEMLTLTRPRRSSDGSFDLGGGTFASVLRQVPGMPEELAALVGALAAPDRAHRPTLAAARAVLKRVRAIAPTTSAVSNVRALASELSLNAFSASMLGARPEVPVPDALRAPGPHVSGTRLGVPPPPVQPSRPNPVPAAPAPPRMAPAAPSLRVWLIAVVAVTVAGAGIAIILLAA